MLRTADDKKEKSLIWLSAVTAVLLLTAVFKLAGRFPGDKHIFMVGDYFVQFMNYIVMFWRKLLSGNGLFYSFDVGLGAATWEQYAFYGFSPFNIVFVFIKDTDTAAFVLLLCKTAAIAVSMQLFLRYALKLREGYSVLFSVSYALCAYVMNFYFCIVLIDYLYMLPLVMLMLDRFMKSGKAGALAAVYGSCFILSYYGGYMIGIFSFVCFVCALFSGRYSTDKKTLIIKYLLAVVSAILISAVVTVPTAAALLAGHGGDAYKGVSLKLFVWDIIADMYPLRKIGENNVLPSVYAGFPALIFGMAYFLNGKRGGKEKGIAAVPLVFLVICSLVAPAYIMMHGFDAPDGYHFRFAYLYGFYMITLAAREVKENDHVSGKLSIALVAALYPAVMLLGKISLPADLSQFDTMKMGLVLFLLVLYYFILTSKAKQKTLLLWAVLILELFMNAYFAITPDKQTLIRWKDTYDLWKTEGEQAVSAINAGGENDGFYRVNYRDGMWANDSMYFGFHGLSYFSSMEQPDTRRALKALGYSTSGRVVVERGGSPFTEMIFAQKYRVQTSPDLSLDEPGKVVVEENENSLPLAFMVSEEILSADIYGNNAFDDQQRLADAMLGHKTELWKAYDGDIEKECENADIYLSDSECVLSKTEPGTGRITLRIPSEPGKQAFAYFSSDVSAMDWSSPIMSSEVQGENIGIVSPVFVMMPSILPLGDEGEKSGMYISFRENTADNTVTKGLHFAYFDPTAAEDIYAELLKGGLKIESFKDDCIKGQIRADAGKSVLFTSIPFEKGWHIRIDGSETESFAVLDGAFLAAKVPAGEHKIEIYYENVYIKAGAVISILGLIMLLMIILCDKEIICKKSQKNFT